MLNVYKIEKRILKEEEIKIKTTYVSISCNDLTLVITREQGARLTKNELACVVLRFLQNNKTLLEEALDYRFKYSNRAVYWYTSDYGATDYYIKYSTDTDFVYSKFLFHETMSGFVLDNNNTKTTKVFLFLPDLIHLILDGTLDFSSDKVVLDYANKLISIIKNEDDTDVQLYNLEQRLPEGAADITDISTRNAEDLQKLQEYEPIYKLKDLLK